jgi:hypothetical protein
VFEFLESLGEPMKAKGVQLVERRMSEHEDFLSVVVAGAAQIRVLEQRGGRIVVGGRVVGFAGEEGGDALAVEDAQFDGAGRDGLDATGVEPTIRAQNPEAGSEPLLGMLSAG